MKPINFKVFEGRSIYSHRKCIKLNLDMEKFCSGTTRDMQEFGDRLLTILPELINHRCSSNEDLGFVKKFHDGISLNHLCGHIALALQDRLGIDVGFCTESSAASKEVYTIYEYKYRDTGIEAGRLAIDIINSFINGDIFDFEFRLDILKEVLENEKRKESNVNRFSKENIRNIPIIAITGTNGKTTTTRLINYVLSKAGRKVGMTTTDGIFANNKCIYEGDTTGPRSALMVLTNDEIDTAVLETARGGLVRHGLAYDLADVAVITNVTDDHLGLDGIETMDDLAKAKMLVAEAVKREGYAVVNGDNDMCVKYLHRIKSKMIIFSENKDNAIMRENIKEDNYGIYIHDNNLCIENKSNCINLMPVEDIAMTMSGALKYNIQNAMAACGALIGFGVEPSVIKKGLENFECSEELNPGRFNCFDVNGVLTILDYGHNIDGYSRVLEGLSKMKHNRLIGVIGVPGDRLDRTTVEVGRIAGNYFHSIFIKEDKDRRGRLPGEVAELLKKGVLDAGFKIRNLKIILDEETAFKEALDYAKPGDIVIIFFEEYAPLLSIVKEKIHSHEKELNLI